jgi:5-methylcytosine-specific restriction endonuclease McrA
MKPRSSGFSKAYPCPVHDGKTLCAWCHKDLPKRKRRYCSDACRIEVEVRCSPQAARREVFKRDDGVCACCGFHAGRLQRVLAIAERMWIISTCKRSKIWTRDAAWLYLQRVRPVLYDEIGLPHNRKSFWDCDHEIQVFDGGGQCGIEALVTLCIWCHKAKTKRLSKRNAKRRKKLKKQETEPCQTKLSKKRPTKKLPKRQTKWPKRSLPSRKFDRATRSR